MSAVRGMLAGALGLAVMQALLSTSTASSALGGIAGFPAKAIKWFLDPRQPLIPDMRTDKTRSVGAAITAAYTASAQGGLTTVPISTGGTGSTPGITQNLDTLPVIPGSKPKPILTLPQAHPRKTS